MAPRRHAKRLEPIMPMSQQFFKSTRCGAKGRVFGTDRDSRTTKTHASEVRKTIEAADVVVEVLDARDPLGSRSAEIEDSVLQKGKRLVLLLNKIDLVPKENVRQWVHYLRQKLPTVAFQASTQEQQNKLGRFKTANLHAETSKCVGADLVMKLLKNYCRNRDIKTTIRVGVVGYPNVGKSSVINSLRRKRTCQAGATPGLTKHAQEIELDSNIRLIDSPGVVLASGDQFDGVEVALRNAVRVEQLSDPATAVMAIQRRCSVQTLTDHFAIETFDDPELFLPLVARRLGRLKKGGVPDVEAAARHVLNEWNSGKLRFHTEVPETENANRLVISSELVAQMSAEFDYESLSEDVRVLVDELGDHEMAVDSGDTGGSGLNVVVEAKPERKEQKAEPNAPNLQSMLAACRKSDGGIQMNRVIKQFSKRHKKRERKTQRKLEKLTDLFSDLGGEGVKMETEDDWFGCMRTTTD